MSRAILLLILALPACTGAVTRPAAPIPAAPPPAALLAQRASAAVDNLVRLNALAQRAAAFILPLLPPERARLVELAAARVDEAIAIVAEARSVAELLVAIASAKDAIADYKRVAGA